MKKVFSLIAVCFCLTVIGDYVFGSGTEMMNVSDDGTEEFVAVENFSTGTETRNQA